MPRYIDAENAAKKLCDFCEYKGQCETMFKVKKCLEYNFIENEPAADVVPVRHGHWLRPFPATPKSYVRICSVCKGKAYAIGKEYDYCPNCQAVMDEEAEK